MIEFIKQLFQDKNQNFSVREAATALFVMVIIISWIAEQFFKLKAPEYMFYSFCGLVSLGCYHYSIEKKTITNNENQNQNKQ